MPTDLDQQLQHLGTLLRELAPPIEADEYQPPLAPLVVNGVAPQVQLRVIDEVRPRSVARRRFPVRLAVLSTAAAALVVGLLVVPGRDTKRPGVVETNSSEPEATVAGVVSTFPDRGEAFVNATDPPLLSMPGSDWTLSYVDDTLSWPVRLAVVDGVQGFAGGSFVVRPAAQSGVLAGTGVDLSSEGMDGTMTDQSDSFRWIEWHVGDELLSAHVRHLSRDDALAIARAISIAPDGSLVLSAVPSGLVLLGADEIANLTRYLEYHWTNESAGTEIGMTLQPGGDIGVQIAAGDSIYEPITLAGRPAFAANDRLGVVLLDGFWVWAIGQTGYTDRDAFLADAASITPTDRTTWEAEVAAYAISPSERPAQVADIVSDIPLPADFDTASLADADRPKVRYQLIAEVTSAVMCAWVTDWDEALTAGDGAGAAAAVAAIASSKTWHALVEIADQGGWSDAVWGDVDRVVAGDRSVVAGMGGTDCEHS
jgi:hypothetical protein